MLSASYSPKQKPKRLVHLSWLIACGYLIPLCLTLVSVGILLKQQITDHLWSSSQARLLDTAFATIGVRLHDDNTENISEQLIDKFGRVTPFTLVIALEDSNQTSRVIDCSGAVIAQGGYLADSMPLPTQSLFDKAKMLAPFEQPFAVSEILKDSNGRDYFTVLIPLSLNGFPDVFLQMFIPWRFAEELTSTLNRLLFWGCLSALVLGILCSFIVGNRLSRPLEKLAHTAKLVENGDLSARTGIICNQREIHDVASSFDQMVSQLEKSFASQKRFVADASHELKTPLTAISGMAELMEDGSEEERQLSLTVMNREIARMSRLVNDLLYLSRAENATPGNASKDKVNIDLYKLLREVVASAQPANFDKELILSDPIKAIVLGDSDSLTRIFHNLIGNAQKYAPGPTPIEIGCRTSRGKAIITVRDHGPGIPEKDLPHVFERFFRSDASRNRKTGGSGLGLAIVQALVEGAGGQASLRNHPDGGLEVTVTLPLNEQVSPA